MRILRTTVMLAALLTLPSCVGVRGSGMLAEETTEVKK